MMQQLSQLLNSNLYIALIIYCGTTLVGLLLATIIVYLIYKYKNQIIFKFIAALAMELSPWLPIIMLGFWIVWLQLQLKHPLEYYTAFCLFSSLVIIIERLIAYNNTNSLDASFNIDAMQLSFYNYSKYIIMHNIRSNLEEIAKLIAINQLACGLIILIIQNISATTMLKISTDYNFWLIIPGFCVLLLNNASKNILHKIR